MFVGEPNWFQVSCLLLFFILFFFHPGVWGLRAPKRAHLVSGFLFAFIFYLRLLEKVGAGRAGYVGVVMPVLALLISTVFENLEWQQDLIIGLPILIIGAVLVINQKIKPIQ